MPSANQIRIRTGIDTSAINKEIENVRKNIETIVSSEAKQNLKEFTKFFESEISAFEKKISDTQKKIDEIKTKINEKESELQNPLLWKSQKGQLQNEIAEYKKQLEELEASKNRTIGERDAFSERSNQQITSLQQEIALDDQKSAQLQEQLESLEQQRQVLSALQSENKQLENKGKLLSKEEYKQNIEMLEAMIAKDKERYGAESEIVKELEKQLAIQQEMLGKAQEETATKNAQLQKDNVKEVEKHNAGLLKTVGSIGKMTLGLLGAQSAYSMIRKLISQVTSENQVLANTIQGFWGGLASMLSPVINYIINGLATILNYAMSIIQVLTGINLLAKAQNSIAKKNGVGGAGSKKKGSLASFDKSEVLQKNDNSGGGAGGTNASMLKNIELNEQLLEILNAIKNIWDRIVEITKEWIQQVDFTMLIDAFNNLLSTIVPLINIIGEYLIFIYQNAILPIAQFFIESIIPFVLNVIAEGLKIITSVLEIMMPYIQYLWDNIIVPLATYIGESINEVLELITSKMSEISDWFKKNAPFVSEKLLEVAKLVVDLYNKYIDPVMKFIIDFLKIGLTFAIEFAFGVLQTFLDNFGGIIDDVKLILQGLINFITGVFSGNWSQAWEGIKQIFGGIWNGIIDIVQGVLNGIVSGINAVIDKLNGIQVTIPSWVPIWGGNSFGINISRLNAPDLSGFKYKVPALAQGAVLQPNKPFMAMLGDQRYGRNLEAPEDLIRQIVAEEAGRNININASGDVGELIRFFKFELEKENSRVGKVLVMG